MNRTYLEEDLHLIRKYFPGAQTVRLRTPFDLTPRRREERFNTTSFRDTNDSAGTWLGAVVWTN
jgi:hypothetical protein